MFFSQLLLLFSSSNITTLLGNMAENKAATVN